MLKIGQAKQVDMLIVWSQLWRFEILSALE
jgi:hypothetical protein